MPSSSRLVLQAMLAAAAALLAPAALAQPEPEEEPEVPLGSRIPRWDARQMASEREAVQVLHRFANCMVRSHAEAAATLLATAPESEAQRAAGQALIGRRNACLWARSMRLKYSLFRGAVAEAFLDRQPDSMALIQAQPSVEEFDAFSARLAAVDQDGLDEDDRALIVGRWVSYCMANEHPELIKALLGTRPSSGGEQQALTASQGAISACLLEGQALRVDRLTIRALFAEALYHRARPPVSAGGSQ
jgi:hypothetical protein